MNEKDPLLQELIALRKKWGMARSDLAEILKVDECTLQKWELGMRDPSWRSIRQWADALGCNVRLQFRL